KPAKINPCPRSATLHSESSNPRRSPENVRRLSAARTTRWLETKTTTTVPCATVNRSPARDVDTVSERRTKKKKDLMIEFGKGRLTSALSFYPQLVEPDILDWESPYSVQ